LAQDEKTHHKDSDEKTPESDATSQIEQRVGEVRDSGIIVSAIEGGEEPIHVGGQQHYGDVVHGDKFGGDKVGRDKITIIYQGAPVTIPSPDAVARHRVALREDLEAEARKHWGGMEVYIKEEVSIPIEGSPYGRMDKRMDLLQTLRDARRLLVLGEPGSGKTVALERLAWELCEGTEPIVPVIVRLLNYDGKPLSEWVRSCLQKTGRLRLDDEQVLTAFLKQEEGCRCYLLFDGLNEVSRDYRDRERRDQLAGELERWMNNYPRHPVILTSRSQDELWRRLRDAEVVKETVVVQPIRDEQIQEYLVKHLGESGNELYGQLELDKHLLEMAQRPIILWMIKETGKKVLAEKRRMPGNRGTLYDEFVSQLLKRDTDREMDKDIPEWVKRDILADLAYNHLGPDQRLSLSREEAEQAVTDWLMKKGQAADRAVGRPLGAGELVGACARHGLLKGEDQLEFAPHQTVQEYFMAVALLEVVKREQNLTWRKRLQRRARRTLTGREEGLALLAADDWWMETFVQLAGLVEADLRSDADWLVQKIGQANPWLAWWCVEEGRGVTDETREAVAKRSEGLLKSDRARDRRRAVAALARMQSERVVRPLLRAVGDPDTEVTGLAVQALAEMGEAARAPVAEALQDTDLRLRRAALRYLAEQPDNPLCEQIPWEEILGQPMVWVEPGPFLMGSDEEKDPQAYGDELPQHKVTLPGYWIGCYPVTVARFSAFLETSRHKPVSEDSLTGPDDHPAVNVTWHDALAYCRWLGEKTGLPVTLPSEAEWEKAARGTGGRIYPWGDEFDESKCNMRKSSIGGTTPVGKYGAAGGDSPYDCADMAGNVWEWTRCVYKGYPYDPQDGRENLEAEDNVRRVVRGGSFDLYAAYVRCALRYLRYPSYRRDYSGFRVVVSPISPSSEI